MARRNVPADAVADDRERLPAAHGAIHRLELRFPWAVLASDNERHTLQKFQNGVRLVAKIGSSPRYRLAKVSAAILASAADGVRGESLPIFIDPVRLVGFVTFPNNRQRDAGNYAKMIKDALEGIIYPTDSLVWDERWIRRGVNREEAGIVLRVRRKRGP